MRMHKVDNRGMSLVEMIVVIAILSVMTAVVGFGLAFGSGKPAEECAQSMESAISRMRTISMGKKDGTYLHIYCDDDGVHAVNYVEGVQTESKVIGASSVDVKYVEGDSEHTLDATGVQLTFDRATGALKSPDLHYFEISKASTTMLVTIEGLTGRVEVSAK